ncbi:hypothetical protein MNBD_NITROSPIRAE03-27, partial [hydrothermal vent metagenome]
MNKRLDGFLKRTFDIITSLSGLVLLGPLIFFLIIFIKLDSPGPAFYR